MYNRIWKLTVGLVVVALALCLTVPVLADSTPTPVSTKALQVVGEDPTPEPFVGTSWWGLWGRVFALYLFGFSAWWGRKLRRQVKEDWAKIALRLLVIASWALFAWYVVRGLADFGVTCLAFSEVGYLDRWLVELVVRISLFVVGAALGGGVLFALLKPLGIRREIEALRAIMPPEGNEPPEYEDEGRKWGSRSREHREWQVANDAYKAAQDQLWYYRPVLWLVAVFAVVIGLVFSVKWLEVLLAFNSRPWGQVDPVFGLDLSFFVFWWPLIEYFMTVWLVTLALAMTSIGVFVYTVYKPTDLDWSGTGRPKYILRMAGSYFGLVAISTWLGIFRYLFSTQTHYSGISTTQLRVGLITAPILAICIGLIAIGLWIVPFFLPELLQGKDENDLPIRERANNSTIIFISASVVLAGVLWLLLGLLAPAVYQAWQISPREDVAQAEQVGWNIEATRQAFGLDRIRGAEYELETPGGETLDPASEHWQDIRLWDWRVVERFLDQRQTVRGGMFNFQDVDVTRMPVGSKKLALMVSMREPALSTWTNMRVRIVSAKGWAAIDPSKVTTDRLPELTVANLPLQSKYPELVPKQFRAYYCEAPQNWVLANAREPEFDTPLESGFTTYRYGGSGGIANTFFSRVVLSIHLGDFRLIRGTYLTPETRLLINRNIIRRVQAVAPFFQWSYDPYPATTGEGIAFIWDGYTTSDTYPEAASHAVSFPDTPWRKQSQVSVRYMRPSIKVVVDGYEGTVRFYIADPEDPIAQTIARCFPGMFLPLEEMPEILRQQLRYPEEMFDLQLDASQRYHVTDPRVFYMGGEEWRVAVEAEGEKASELESRYLLTRLPGSQDEEFILINAYSPKQTRNLVAWMAARCDPGRYGELMLFRFTGGTQILGPADAERQANMLGPVSTALNNWQGGGNTVLPGKLIVVPVDRSVLYIEPIHVVPSDPDASATMNLVVIAAPCCQPAYHTDLEKALRAFRGEIASYAPVFSEQRSGQPAEAPVMPISANCDDLLRQLDEALSKYRQGDAAAAENIARIALEIGLRCGK